MKKKIIIAIVIAALAAFAAAKFPWSSLPDGPAVVRAAPESAMPPIGDGDRYMLIKFEHPDSLRSKLSTFLDTVSALTESGGISRNYDSAKDFLSRAADLLEVPESFALLVVSGDEPTYYLSFVPNVEKFEAFVSDDGRGAYEINEWQDPSAAASHGAWTVDFLPDGSQLGVGERLYMTRTGPDDSPVLVATSPEDIELMRGALDGSKPRLEANRFNEAPDYIQGRFELSLAGSDDKKPSVFELAWDEGEDSEIFQFYCDALNKIGGRPLPRSSASGLDLPIAGDGELAFAAALDVPYLCYMAFPWADDPVAEVVSDIFDPIGLPAAYRADFETVLRDSRLFGVIVAGKSAKADKADKADNELNTAYLLLETKEKRIVDKYYGLVGFLLPSIGLDGWDSAYSKRIDEFEFAPILARKDGYVAFGIAANTEDFAKKGTVPKAFENFVQSGDIMSFVATSNLLDSGDGAIGQEFKLALRERGIPVDIVDRLNLSGVETVKFRMTGPENAELSIFWDKNAIKKSEEASAR